MVEAFREVIRSTPESSENMKLSGFGNFQLQDKSQRRGRNPKTGETATISAWRIVMLHASQKLKARLDRPCTSALWKASHWPGAGR